MAVNIGEENILAAVAPVHHMVIGARIFYSHGLSHKQLFKHLFHFVNFKDLTPFFDFLWESEYEYPTDVPILTIFHIMDEINCRDNVYVSWYYRTDFAGENRWTEATQNTNKSKV